MILEQVPSVDDLQEAPRGSQQVDPTLLAQVTDMFKARVGKAGVPSAPPAGHNFGSRRSLGGPAFMGGTTTGRPQAPRLQA